MVPAPRRTRRLPWLCALPAAMLLAKLSPCLLAEDAGLSVHSQSARMRHAEAASPPDSKPASLQSTRMVDAVGRLRKPSPLAPRRSIPTLMLLAKEVHLGHDARRTAHRLTLVRLAKRTPGDAAPLTTRIPNTSMLRTIFSPQPNSAVAPRRRASMVVAGAAVALDLSHAGAPAVVAADVVAAGHGARVDGLVAGDAAGPATRVLAAVGSLVAAGVGAGVGLADVFFAGVAGR